MAVTSVKELIVYQKSYTLAMEFFELSKAFPAEERYAFTSQGRRSSRSVPMNLREAWAKRRYAAHFISKLEAVPGGGTLFGNERRPELGIQSQAPNWEAGFATQWRVQGQCQCIPDFKDQKSRLAIHQADSCPLAP